LQNHDNSNIVLAGAKPDEAGRAMIMLHGRGATAEGIMDLAGEFNQPDMLFIAPQASANSWYPFSFMAETEKNEPGLSSALALIKKLVESLKSKGITEEKVFLLGFSQGACLALEFAARNATRYAGVIGLSGGLIGPEDVKWNYNGSFGGTPVFLGCDVQDSHIPAQRVNASAEELKRMGANVILRFYRDLGHTIARDEIEAVNEILKKGPQA